MCISFPLIFSKVTTGRQSPEKAKNRQACSPSHPPLSYQPSITPTPGIKASRCHLLPVVTSLMTQSTLTFPIALYVLTRTAQSSL